MEEKEVKNIYAIPANYTDSGKLLGGMIEPRNAVETAILLILAGYPELMWIPMPGTIRIGRDADASCSAQCDGY